MISTVLLYPTPGEIFAILVVAWFALGLGFFLGAAWGFNGHRSRMFDLLAVMSHVDRTYVMTALERAKDLLDEKGEVR